MYSYTNSSEWLARNRVAITLRMPNKSQPIESQRISHNFLRYARFTTPLRSNSISLSFIKTSCYGLTKKNRTDWVNLIEEIGGCGGTCLGVTG